MTVSRSEPEPEPRAEAGAERGGSPRPVAAVAASGQRRLDRGAGLDDLDGLARAWQAGESAALATLFERLSAEVRWVTGDAIHRLPPARSVDAADLRQEAWLAVVETVRTWRREEDGPFRWAALRALRRCLRRYVRRNRTDAALPFEHASGGAGRATDEPVDPDARADASRWSDVALARQVAASLPDGERAALVLHAVAERPLAQVAANLGLSRHSTRRLLARAHLHARALAGATPPAATYEARVLAAARLGADPRTGQVPAVFWLVPRTGLGRRRVRATLQRLGQLGYLRRHGRRWRLNPLLSDVA